MDKCLFFINYEQTKECSQKSQKGAFIMLERHFKVINTNSIYYGEEGILSSETDQDCILKMEISKYSLPKFDKSEVEEVTY